jgi:hypothetical protein
MAHEDHFPALQPTEKIHILFSVLAKIVVSHSVQNTRIQLFNTWRVGVGTTSTKLNFPDLQVSGFEAEVGVVKPRRELDGESALGSGHLSDEARVFSCRPTIYNLKGGLYFRIYSSLTLALHLLRDG